MCKATSVGVVQEVLEDLKFIETVINDSSKEDVKTRASNSFALIQGLVNKGNLLEKEEILLSEQDDQEEEKD